MYLLKISHWLYSLLYRPNWWFHICLNMLLWIYMNIPIHKTISIPIRSSESERLEHNNIVIIYTYKPLRSVAVCFPFLIYDFPIWSFFGSITNSLFINKLFIYKIYHWLYRLLYRPKWWFHNYLLIFTCIVHAFH